MYVDENAHLGSATSSIMDSPILARVERAMQRQEGKNVLCCQTNALPGHVIQRGLLWQQRDKLFARWKERYFILTRDYLHCFRKSTDNGLDRISHMGPFIFKIKLVDVERVTWINKKTYSAIALDFGRDNRILLRSQQGLEDWFDSLEECTIASKERRRALKCKKDSYQGENEQNMNSMNSNVEDWLAARKKIAQLQRDYTSDSVPDITKLDSPSLRSSVTTGKLRTGNDDRWCTDTFNEANQRLSLLTDIDINALESSSSLFGVRATPTPCRLNSDVFFLPGLSRARQRSSIAGAEVQTKKANHHDPPRPRLESLWNRVSEIISFYNSDMTGVKEEVQVPVGTDCTLSPIVPHDAQTESAIKKLVCSPDLPVFEETPSSSSPDTTFQCSFCNKTFPQKNTYQNHLRSHSKDGEDPYQCNICAKTFAVPARLTRHYRTHTGEKPYQCEYCNKSFSVKENLSVHRRIHTKERPYKCDICDRAFEHSGKLHRHMRIHTGERPHKCTICSKTFIQSGQLVIHMRTHTGEKPYVCKVCGKGFTCSKQLKVHTRTHTGEKPYNCEICGKSFGYNHVLKLHQVAHYGEKVYKCTICNETFTSKKTMELHIKSHSEQPNAQRVQAAESGETSCASSTSDKENKESDSEVRLENYEVPKQSPQALEIVLSPPTATPVTTEPSKATNLKELRYYLYYPKSTFKPTAQPPQGVDPALLAAAAVAAASETGGPPGKLEEEGQLTRYDQQYEIAQCSTNASHNPIEPSIYLCPDPLATMQRQNSPYSIQLCTEYIPGQIEVAEKTERENLSPVLTPPSSNPVSPAPSMSPDPIDLAQTGKEILILPPRKRSKMILKSMEYATEATPRLRQNSVIQFARSSSIEQKT